MYKLREASCRMPVNIQDPDREQSYTKETRIGRNALIEAVLTCAMDVNELDEPVARRVEAARPAAEVVGCASFPLGNRARFGALALFFIGFDCGERASSSVCSRGGTSTCSEYVSIGCNQASNRRVPPPASRDSPLQRRQLLLAR